MLSDTENVVQLLEHESAMDEMADKLHQVHAVDAAMETLAIAAQLRWIEARVMAHVARLRDVWRAVEDPAETNAIAKSLAAYRRSVDDLRAGCV
jgi:DNA-binding FrmR family transcriptional regulator